MLEKISSRFRLDAQETPSSMEEIEALKAYASIPIPDDYLTLIAEGADFEFAVDDIAYIRIWGASRCVEMNRAYNIPHHMPNSLAIGDNEGGSALVLLPKAQRQGLYLSGFGSLDVEEAKFIAPSLTDLLIGNKGIEAILEDFL